MPTQPQDHLVEVLSLPGCPSGQPALALVQEVVGRLAPRTELRQVLVEDPAAAVPSAFYGSPSVRIDGRDLELDSRSEPVFACRTYEQGSGVPPKWLVEAALLRALRPERFLFLCVANSARSQLAEGIARSLASTLAGRGPGQLRSSKKEQWKAVQ
jgi:hypothetical protein